jgi:cellulose synthase/poly-beta-1,6-N-acetylglucosamine synthase-like glycosyltransferase
MHDHTNSSIVKLASGLVLLLVGAVFMCVGIRWLFFLGLAVIVLAGLFSLRPRTSVSRLGGIMSWLARLGAIALFLWLSSAGREPLSWAGACAGIFAVGMTQFSHWRMNRRTAQNA